MRFEIAPVANAALEAQLRARLDSLTKPPGSLGRLEEIAVRVGLMQGTARPGASRKAMFICCGDHGVVAEGVSPFPQEVTRQMVANFLRGGAAINVDGGVKGGAVAGAIDRRAGDGTANFTREPAMSVAQAERCIENGIALARGCDADVLAAGEMGIGNTTAAAALFSAFANLDPAETAGKGTGLDDRGVLRKQDVIRRALSLHASRDALSTLAALGGFEIATIVGLIFGAAMSRRPIVLDGFITCAAALVVRAMDANALDYVLFSHRSAERGHRRMLGFLAAEPLLDLGLRLGEGSGAAIGISIVEAAIRLYSEMATFAEAAVSTS
jgi:nicotinate-nucleotide--dimethylbenzimidazole phosphoribosyltransferase